MTKTIKGKLTLGLVLTISIIFIITFFITNKYEEAIDKYDTLTDNVSYVEEILIITETITENVAMTYTNFDVVLAEDTINLLNELTEKLDLLEESLNNDGSRYIFDRLTNTINHFDDDTRTFIIYMREDNITFATDYRESIIRTRDAIESIASDMITNELSQMSINRVTLSESLSKSRTQLMVLLFAITSLLIFLLWNINKGIVNNIKGLQVLFRAIGQGDLDYVAPILNTRDEFDQLMVDANKMKNDLQEKEKALKESMKKNSALINAIPDILFILDRDGVILDYRAQESELLYENPEVFIGKKMKGVLPIDVGLKFESQFKELNNTNEVLPFDYSLILDNETRYYEARSIASGSDQIICIIRDITELKKKEDKLILSIKELNNRDLMLKASYDSQPDTIIISLDKNYKYQFFNESHFQTMKEIYGSVIEEGVCIFDYMTSEKDVNGAKEIYDKVLSGENHTNLQQYGDIVINYYESKYSPIKNDLNEVTGIFIVTENVTERIAREQEIEHLSYHDQLTGLYNRRFFEEQIKRLDNPRNLPLTIIMGDVNGLKLINDAFGHSAGDKLLEMIGNIISESIRGNDIASRWGGDEFTILLPSSDSDAANILIKRIQSKIKEASFKFGSLSISFGVDTKKEEHEDISKIFTNAEEFMYQNKLVEIDSIRGQTINTIMTTLFEKSAEVKDHSTRVSELAFLIAEKMELSKTNTNDIKTMGLIHDIGKIVIDLHILDKPGKLTDEERKIIEQHPLAGSRMLNSSHEYSRLSAGVLHHHERIDGKGYPNGIKGNQIPIESRIIAVADAYDAMTAERPYRLNPLTMDQAISELQKHSGSQFDETVVDVFVNKVLLNSE